MDRRRFLEAGAVGLFAASGCISVPAQSGTSTGTGTTSGEAVETPVTNLEVPWGAAWRDGDLYLTERPGRLVRVPGGSGEPEPVVESWPDLRPRGEGGLLGLAFHPEQPIAFTYGTYEGTDGPENRVLRHDLSNGWAREPLLTGIPASNIHDGGRLLVYDGALYVTTGDASNGELAQDPDSLAGKVLRLTLDGSPHPDNESGTAVFTLGHRNPQGLSVRDGTVYATEHGPNTDDEVQRLVNGANYGWPVVKGPSDEGQFRDPLTAFTPTIAPGGAQFYPADGAIEAWRDDLLFGTLAGEHLHRTAIAENGREVTANDRLFRGEFGRLRTTFLGPDGHLYATTSNRDGRGSPVETDDRVLRFVPAEG